MADSGKLSQLSSASGAIRSAISTSPKCRQEAADPEREMLNRRRRFAEASSKALLAARAGELITVRSVAKIKCVNTAPNDFPRASALLCGSCCCKRRRCRGSQSHRWQSRWVQRSARPRRCHQPSPLPWASRPGSSHCPLG